MGLCVGTDICLKLTIKTTVQCTTPPGQRNPKRHLMTTCAVSAKYNPLLATPDRPTFIHQGNLN